MDEPDVIPMLQPETPAQATTHRGCVDWMESGACQTAELSAAVAGWAGFSAAVLIESVAVNLLPGRASLLLLGPLFLAGAWKTWKAFGRYNDHVQGGGPEGE